jgi:hypothetical protein
VILGDNKRHAYPATGNHEESQISYFLMAKSITTHSRVLLDKVTVCQVIKKFTYFHIFPKFITVTTGNVLPLL